MNTQTTEGPFSRIDESDDAFFFSRDDPYADAGLPSDPVYAVFAERCGAPLHRTPRPPIRLHSGPRYTVDEIRSRKRQVGDTLRCPYCDVSLTPWRLPDTPFNEWDVSDVYVCFNQDCSYTVRSLGIMQEQGVRGVGYRLLYNPDRDCLLTVPDTYFGSPRG